MDKDQSRQPKGQTTGGQFAASVNPEAQVDLFNDQPTPTLIPVDPREFLRERVEALSLMGYLPASTAPLLVDPNSTAHRREWWDRHMAAGEYNHPEGGYAQMPDDWTPQRTGGNSIAGHRRTHRMAYANDQVAIRMPSAAAIKDFALANVPGKDSGDTFDVPVSAQFPGGQFDGWVRVARGEDGSWATQGLGFTPDQSAYVAESVHCVLESRRPSRALAEVGDILERRRQRAAQLGVPVKSVSSSWISGVAYEKVTGTMVMATESNKGGSRLYGFKVPIAAFMRVAQSEAPGRIFNQMIRGQSERVEVKECGKCLRAYATESHRCPAKVSARREFMPNVARARDYLRGRSTRLGLL